VSIEPKHLYTLEEFLALERESDTRYEYWDGQIFCMSGASAAHNRIAGNVFGELRAQLKGRSCEAFNSDQRVKVPAAPPYRYPDVSVVCGEPQFEDVQGLDVLVNPALLVEVLSETTEKYDRETKFTYYKSIPDFREYLLIAQDRVSVTHYVSEPDGSWTGTEIPDLALSLHLPAVDCTLALESIYERVKLPETR
jgi:Uma2 family endonuclease